ncbi:MAG: tetratricopeptide repeat protein, partial [Planctomycetes bacterium]|nr:tetratricopeptide repeat protein [Planctomycetota bacterium]
DPHQPVSDFSLEFYTAKCNSCHREDDCNRPPRLREPSQPTACVRCHMPQRKTREGQHLVFTDHLIQNPVTGGEELAEPPLLPPDANVELIPAHGADNRQLQKYLGMAYVKLHTSMGPQTPSLARGVQMLSADHAREPEDRQIQYWLGTGLLAQYRGKEAIRVLRELLSKDPQNDSARFRLAVAYQQNRNFELAITEYERLIRRDPDWLQPYPLVIRLHLSRGNTADAVRLLDQQLSYRDDETARLNLALGYHQQGRPLAESLQQIEASLRLNPRNPTAFNTRAYLYRLAGDLRSARADYTRALQIDPNNQEALTGLKSLQQD